MISVFLHLYLFNIEICFLPTVQPLNTSKHSILNDSTTKADNGSFRASTTSRNYIPSTFPHDVNQTTSTHDDGLQSDPLGGLSNSSAIATTTEAQEYDINSKTATLVTDIFTDGSNRENDSVTPMSDIVTTTKDTFTTDEKYPGQCDNGWVGHRQFCYKVGVK